MRLVIIIAILLAVNVQCEIVLPVRNEMYSVSNLLGEDSFMGSLKHLYLNVANFLGEKAFDIVHDVEDIVYVV